MNNRQNYQQPGHKGRNDNRPEFDKKRISLGKDKLPKDLFSQVAEDAAKYVGEYREQGKPKQSKSTQLRKFYDEICTWDEKVQLAPGKFDEHLPFILMLKAKVAYAKGRNHVSKAYVDILNHCLSELEAVPGPKTLHNLKLFMEAFTGFYKLHGPNN